MKPGDMVWYDLSRDSVYKEKLLAVRKNIWGNYEYLITFGLSGSWVSARKLTPVEEVK